MPTCLPTPRGFLRGCVLSALVLGPAAGHGQDLLVSPLAERTLEGPAALQRLALSPDGLTALLLQQDGNLRAVTLATGKLLRSFGPLPGRVEAIAVGGGRAFLATATQVWSAPLAQDEAPRKLWDADGTVHALDLSPDLDLLAVATAKGAKVIDPGSGTVLWSSATWSSKPCAGVAFAPVGGTLALATGKAVQLLAVPGFKQKQSWTFSFPVLALAFAPDARTLAVGGGQGSLLVKRVHDGETARYLNADFAGKDVTRLAFAADGSGLFAASGRRLQSFSGLDEGSPYSRIVDLDGDVRSLAFSRPAAALLAATEGGRALARWSVRNPLLAHRPRRDRPWIAVLSPAQGARVSQGSVDLTFKLTFPADQPVTAVRILADGRPARIVAGSTEGVLSRSFQSGQIVSCQVELPPRDTTLLLQAEGPQGAGEPALVTLQRGPSPRPPGNARVVPPTVTLVSPGADALLPSAAVDVVLRLASAPGQPVQALRVTLDGVPLPLKDLQLASGAPFDPAVGWVDGESYRLPIQVLDREAALMVVAETAYAASAPVEARLRLRPPAAAAATANAAAPGETPVRAAEEPNGKVKAGSENATRILEGGPQGAAVPMEVDAKGRLRWRDPAADPAKKAHSRSVSPAATAAPTPARAPGLPSVQILAPAGGSKFKEREVQLSVKLAGQDVGRIQVFVDGSPADAAPLSQAGAPLAPPFPTGQPFKVRVALPPQDCQVSVLAENAAGPGRPALLKLKYDGKAAPAGTARSVSQLAKPRIAIFEPLPNALVRGKAVQIGVRVGLDPRQPPPAVRVLVDAQEVKAERAVQQRGAVAPQPAADRGGSEEIQYYTIPIPPKDCTVVAYAETPYATSDPSLVKLRWDAPTLASSATGMPTMYLLSVGVSKYKDKNFTLQYPAKDARDFAETMKLQKGKLYKDVVARIRTDETATRDNVMDDLEWIQRQATQRDMVVVFFAGHGINDIVTGNYYYLPWDANMEAVKRTMIPGSEIHSTLAKLTGTRLLFMDTCHAGNVTGTATRGVPDMQQFLQDLKEGGQGLVVITSSRPGQKSQEHPSWNNGAFTKALVEGLRGKAPQDRQGFITFTALDAYITSRVKELTKGTQAPATQKSTEVSDFPLAFGGN